MNLEQTKIRRYIAYIQLPVKVHGFHFAVLILVYSVCLRHCAREFNSLV